MIIPMRNLFLIITCCLFFMEGQAQQFSIGSKMDPALVAPGLSKMQSVPAESAPLGYCTNALGIGVGTGQLSTLGAAIYLSPTQLAAKGNEMIAMRIALGSDKLSNLKIFVKKNLLSDEVVYEKAITEFVAGWNYIPFESFLPVGEDGLFFGYVCETSDYALGCEQLGKNNDGDWVSINNDWSHLSASNLNVVNQIQVMMTGGDYSSSIQYDAVIVEGEIANRNYAASNSNFSAQYTIYNNGVKTLTDFDVALSVNNVKDTVRIKGVQIPNCTSYQVTVGDFMVPKEGSVEASCTIFNLNGNNVDEVIANNTNTQSLLVFDQLFERNILIEQFTGQDCGYCPGGATMMKNAIEPIKDRVSIVAHHTYGTDLFTLSESKTIGMRYSINSAPSFMVNRDIVAGNSYNIYPQYVSTSVLQKCIDTPAPVSLNMTNSYDPNTSELRVTVSGECAAILTDAVLNIWLTQDGIVSRQNGATSNYVHNNAIRLLITPVWGDQLERNGTSFKNTYTVTVPKKVGSFNCVIENMAIVAFVHNQSSVARNSQVYNATKQGLEVVSGLVNTIDNRQIGYVVNGNEVTIEGDYQRIDLYDVNGVCVKQLKGEETIILSTGMYIAKAILESRAVETQKMMIK